MSSGNPFAPISGKSEMDNSAKPASAPAPSPAPSPAPPTPAVSGFGMLSGDLFGGSRLATGHFGSKPAGQESAPAPASSMRPKERVIDALPAEFKLQEGKTMDNNPYISSEGTGNADLVHSEYRSSDTSRFKEIKAQQSIPAIVILHDQIVEEERPFVAGFLPPVNPSEDEKKLVSIRVSFLTNTQFTGVRLHIPRRGQKEAQYKIFGNAVCSGGKSSAFVAESIDKTYDAARRNSLYGREDLNALADKSDLLATHIKLWSSSAVKNHETRKRPTWTGISRTEIEQILIKFDDEALRPKLSESDMLIARIERTSFLSVFRRIKINDESGPVSTQNFCDYMNAAMWLNVFHGALWFYKLQAPGVSLMDPNFPLDCLEVPRWLVEKWMATVDKDDKVLECKPFSWVALPQVLEYPDAECCAFLASLGATREAENTRDSIKRMLNSNDGILEARFRQTKGLPDQYLVEVHVPGDIKATGNWETMKPAVETRIKIKVLDDKYKITLHGQVLDDIFGRDGTNYDFIAGVKGPEITFPDKLVNIEIELINDPTGTNRALNALELLSHGVSRNKGVDLCHDLLGAPPTIPTENHGALAASLDKPKLEAAMRRLESNYGLNDGQIAAAKGFIEEGYTLVWGPAGTGKTSTCASGVNEIARLGVKQIFACPSNRAVDKALEDCLKINPKLRAVRFVGGYRGGNPRASKDTSMDVDSGAAQELDETWEMYLDLCDLKEVAHPEHLFHVVKLRAIQDFASQGSHPQCENAKQYLKLRDDLSNATGKDRKKLRAELESADYPLHDYFLANCVDAVFVTCASAPHDDLATFKPEVVIIDESGQATLADICMTTAPFKESILSLNLTGDYVQLGPVVTADKCNEALNILNKSHFEKHIKDGGENWAHHMLTQHYRSHPDITELPNLLYYHGKLENDISTTVENGIQKTLRQCFKNLGVAWNNKWRMAIDMSTTAAHSKRFGKTSSVCNEIEADFIVDLTHKLVSFEPVDDGALPKAEKITPGHIGIFTPYKGQARVLTKKLKSKGLHYSVTTRGTGKQLKFLGTTHGIQGGDADISIVSGVIRDPQDANKNVKFIGNPKNIAVNTTRGRYLDISLANIGPVAEVIKNRQQGSYLLNQTMGTYRKMIEYLQNNKSIISATDFELAVLADKPQLLQSSSYQKSHNYLLGKPAMAAAKVAKESADREAAKGPKAKGKFAQREKRANTAQEPKVDTKRPKNKPGQSAGGKKSAPPPAPSAPPATPGAAATTNATSSELADDLSGLNVTGSKQTKKERQKKEAADRGMSYSAYLKTLKTKGAGEDDDVKMSGG